MAARKLPGLIERPLIGAGAVDIAGSRDLCAQGGANRAYFALLFSSALWLILTSVLALRLPR